MRGDIVELTDPEDGRKAFDLVIAQDTDEVNVADQRQAFVKKVESSKTVVYAYRHPSDRFIGTCCLTIETGIDEVPDHIWGHGDVPNPSEYIDDGNEVIGFLSSMYVIEPYRGRGLGSELYEAIEEYARETCDCIMCEIWAHTKGGDGRQLMHKYNFECVFSSEGHWRSVFEEDVECNKCGFDCDCLGQIWYKNFE